MKKVAVAGISCMLVLSLSACNLTINGKQVFGDKKETEAIESLEDDSKDESKTRDKKNSDEKDTGYFPVSNEEAKEMLKDAIETLKTDNFIYLLESSTKDSNGDDLSIESNVYINNSNNTAANYYVANGKDVNGNDATQETINTFRQNKSDLTWTVEECILTFDNESDTKTVGKADTFFNILFSGLDKKLFNVEDDIQTYGTDVVYKSEFQSTEYKITLDTASKKIRLIELKDIETSGKTTNNTYEFLYEEDSKFDEVYDKLSSKCSESNLEYSDILTNSINKSTEIKETKSSNESLDIEAKEVDGKKLVLEAFEDVKDEKCYVNMVTRIKQTETDNSIEADIYGIYNLADNTAVEIISGSIGDITEKAIKYVHMDGSKLISESVNFDSTEISKENATVDEYNLKALLSTIDADSFTTSNKAYKVGDDWEIEINSKIDEQSIYVVLEDRTNKLLGLSLEGTQDGMSVEISYDVAYPGTEDFELEYGVFIDELNKHNKALDIADYVNGFSSSKYSSIENNVTTNEETESYNSIAEETEENVARNSDIKSDYALEAEKEIEGYLGKKVSDFKFEHCSYDFAEASTMYQPREKTKIKLTYADFSSGKSERAYKTLTLENKSSSEVGISGMTVINIE